MHLKEQSIDPRCYRSPRQKRNELRLPALTPPAAEGCCTECVPSNTTGAIRRITGSER